MPFMGLSLHCRLPIIVVVLSKKTTRSDASSPNLIGSKVGRRCHMRQIWPCPKISISITACASANHASLVVATKIDSPKARLVPPNQNSDAVILVESFGPSHKRAFLLATVAPLTTTPTSRHHPSPLARPVFTTQSETKHTHTAPRIVLVVHKHFRSLLHKTLSLLKRSKLIRTLSCLNTHTQPSFFFIKQAMR